MEINSEIEELTKEKLDIEVEKLKREEDLRSKKNLLSMVLVTTTMIVTVFALYTSIVQDRKKIELESILDRQVTFKSIDLREESERARIEIEKLLDELQEQSKAIESVEISSTENLNEKLPKDIIQLNARVTAIEASLRRISDSQVVSKIKAIEESIEGNPVQVLSVPLIRNDLKNYKLVSEKELLRLEKNLERLDSRLSFFVTTTITLTLGIFTAVIAPLLVSLSQKRKEKSEAQSHSKQRQVDA